MNEPSRPGGESEKPVEALPEKGPDAARQFSELLEQARRLQRERGFSSKAGGQTDESEQPTG